MKKEDWMNSKWRPLMGYVYMAICCCDFILFPVLWSILQVLAHSTTNSQWQPLTLQGAGLLHIAFGGILGVAAYGRTQEKLGGVTLPTTTTYTPPAPTFTTAPVTTGKPLGPSQNFPAL